MKSGKTANGDAVTVFKTAFNNFRNKAAERKKTVRQENQADEKEFSDWLFKQQMEADRLMDEIT